MAWAVFRVCSSSQTISATTGASAQSAFLNAPMYGLSVSSALFSNPAIPGDITELFALSGSGIGGGSLRESFFGSGIFLGLRIDTVSANGAVGGGIFIPYSDLEKKKLYRIRLPAQVLAKRIEYV